MALAGFVEESLEHNMMTAREIVSHNLGCYLARNVRRFVMVITLYFAGITLYFLESAAVVAGPLFFILFLGAGFTDCGQIYESDGTEVVEI